jgi:hypothetical protein
VSALRKAAFDPHRSVFQDRGEEVRRSAAGSVEVFLAPALQSPPPAAPFGGNTLRIILWSLELRSGRWWNDSYKGQGPTCVYSSCITTRSQARGSRIRQVCKRADRRRQRLCGVGSGRLEQCRHRARAAAHARRNGQVRPEREVCRSFPSGYADPEAIPLLPQARAEIMAGRIPISDTLAEIAGTT